MFVWFVGTTFTTLTHTFSVFVGWCAHLQVCFNDADLSLMNLFFLLLHIYRSCCIQRLWFYCCVYSQILVGIWGVYICRFNCAYADYNAVLRLSAYSCRWFCSNNSPVQLKVNWAVNASSLRGVHSRSYWLWKWFLCYVMVFMVMVVALYVACPLHI